MSLDDCPFLIAPSVVSNVYLQCLWIVHSWLLLQLSLTFIYQCLWMSVHSWLPLQFSLTFIYNVSGWVSILDCPFSCLYCLFTMSLDCPFLIAPSGFSNIYLQCLWIVHSWLLLQVSLTFIYSVSGLSILDCPFSFL